MAKKKSSGKKPLIPSAVKRRLKLLPGAKRQRLDPKTGKIYSRRQWEKGRIPIPRKNAPDITRKYRQYLQIRDSYLEKQNVKRKKKITKREAMNSDRMKQLIKDLHSKDPKRKKRALEQTSRGDKVKDWTPYLKRWAEGNL